MVRKERHRVYKIYKLSVIAHKKSSKTENVLVAACNMEKAREIADSADKTSRDDPRRINWKSKKEVACEFTGRALKELADGSPPKA